jgi:hypothetical protein
MSKQLDLMGKFRFFNLNLQIYERSSILSICSDNIQSFYVLPFNIKN